jgi:tetratricopeptide (TPR) repeat protein
MANDLTAPEVELERLRQHVANNPGDVETWVRLGALLFESFHDGEEATRALTRALDLAPNDVDARFWLALCLFHVDVDMPRAREVLEQALRLDPKRPECLMLLVAVLADLGHSVATYLPYLEEASRLAPDWVTVHRSLAATYLELGRLADAEDQLLMARALLGSVEHVPGSVEEYYEVVVTGRKDTPHWREELNDLGMSIAKAKVSRYRHRGESPSG